MHSTNVTRKRKREPLVDRDKSLLTSHRNSYSLMVCIAAILATAIVDNPDHELK